MDPFEVRMQFITLLSRLTSSLASIQKVSAFATKHGPKCGADIWDCLVEECARGSMNARINLLFFLDTLLSDRNAASQPYAELVKRDLGKVVELVVPDSREGMLNLMSANQVLRSWKLRRLLEADVLDPIEYELEARRARFQSQCTGETTGPIPNFSRNDILRRIEDDRERHKRLREKIWVLPIPESVVPTYSLSSTNGGSNKTSPTSPASPAEPPATVAVGGLKASASAPPTVMPRARVGQDLPVQIEFDQLWDKSSEEMRAAFGVDRAEWDSEAVGQWALGEEETQAIAKANERCFKTS